jgi:ABC-type transporter Mla subunit MlaD
MDIQTIDTQYDQLQSQAQQTAGQLKALAQKLQAARDAGNQDAREWLLDLREVALAIQAEQNQVGGLLQALHNFVANQPASPAASVPQTQPVAQPAQPAQPWGAPQQAPYPPPPPQYPQQGYPPAYPQQQGGGLLGGFLNSGFGRAIAMGAGFGLGDDLINSIF